MCISGMLGGIVVLLYVLGEAALCGLGVMVSVMAINWKLSGRTKRAEAKALGHADEGWSIKDVRVQLTNLRA